MSDANDWTTKIRLEMLRGPINCMEKYFEYYFSITLIIELTVDVVIV